VPTLNPLLNVIDLTNRFITGVEAPFLYAKFPWPFSALPDGFNGYDEQIKQLIKGNTPVTVKEKPG